MSDESTSSVHATRLEPPILQHDECTQSHSPMVQQQPEDSMAGALYTEPKTGIVYQIMYPLSNSSHHVDTQMYTRPTPPIHIPIPDNPAAQTLPVSCGNVIGKMHLHLFLCPGIHQPCIEHGNELLTPKQFTVRADKEKQKDWKASIRIGKSSLRIHMEARTIDFHDHANRCSGKCQSRNYVNCMNEVKIEELQIKKAKRSAESAVLLHELNEITGFGDGAVDETTEEDELQIDVVGGESEASKKAPGSIFKEKKTRGRPKGSINKARVKIEQMSEQVFNNLPVDDVIGSSNVQNAPTPAGCTPYNEILNCLQNDPKHFWEQMHTTGVISHFCDDIIVSAINLKQSVLTMSEISTNTANCLTRSAFAFGIQSMIVQRVQSIEKSVVQQQKHQEMLLDMMSGSSNNNTADVTETPAQSSASEVIAESENVMNFIENQATSKNLIGNIKIEPTL